MDMWCLQRYIGEESGLPKTIFPKALMSRVLMSFEYVKSTIHVGEGNGWSNHLMPLIQVLHIHAMPGERRWITNSKAHHLK
jgi:hypothetical protein